MGSGSKKGKGIDMGSYTSNPSEFNAFRWCTNNGIYISPKASSTTEWYVNISMHGKNNLSPNTYKKVDIWKQIYLFYLYYYNKYNTDIKIEPMLVTKKKETKVKQQSTDKQLF
jgi:hypothetical protein